MAEQMGFKSSMFGFDKKMVMDYIYKLGEEARRQEETYNAKLSQLERDRDAVARRAGEAETQLQEMTAQLQEEKSAASEAAKMIQSLSDEIERQKRISSEKEREIQIQNERCRQLQFRAESLESRSRKYEELSRNVGEILLAAHWRVSLPLCLAAALLLTAVSAAIPAGMILRCQPCQLTGGETNGVD